MPEPPPAGNKPAKRPTPDEAEGAGTTSAVTTTDSEAAGAGGGSASKRVQVAVSKIHGIAPQRRPRIGAQYQAVVPEWTGAPPHAPDPGAPPPGAQTHDAAPGL
jgi:hypothetical protein